MALGPNAVAGWPGHHEMARSIASRSFFDRCATPTHYAERGMRPHSACPPVVRSTTQDQSPAPGTESYVQQYRAGALACHSLTAPVDQSLTGSHSSTIRALLVAACAPWIRDTHDTASPAARGRRAQRWGIGCIGGFFRIAGAGAGWER